MDNTSFYIIENKLENLERASEALESFRRSANLTKTDAQWCDEVISPMVNDLATKLYNLHNQLQKLDDEAEKFFAFNA
tara:strand:- start:242 stop:475 length:234 start_codon:yes stop_codon:yes gene_type:complete